MTTYLVTGGAGFIGSHYVETLLRTRPDAFILIFDALTYAGLRANVERELKSARVRFICGDIVDADTMADLFRNYDIAYVINFAAESHVDRSIIDPNLFVKTNVAGTGVLMNAAREAWGSDPTRRFLQVSTDEVYGSLSIEFPQRRGDRYGENLFNEDSPLKPSSPYSASKASADLLVGAYVSTYGFPAMITRCGNNYGPRQYPEKLIPVLINAALRGAPLPIYGSGLAVRDWIYVTDHCLALNSVLHDGVPGEIYHISAGIERNTLEMAELVLTTLREAGVSLAGRALIQHVPDRPAHDIRYALDSAKIERALGWAPLASFEETFKETVLWYYKRSREIAE